MAKKINPIIFAFIVPVLGGIVLVAVLLLDLSSFSSGAPLNIAAYKSDWRTATPGKTYRLHCTVVRRLKTGETGSLFLVQALEKGKAGESLAVFAPPAIASTMEANQRFKLSLRPLDDGFEITQAKKD